MKTKKTILMLLFTILTASSVFANQSVELNPISFQLNSENVLYKFEQTLMYPEDLLNRFQPVGATITKKRVSHNVISFVATKSKLFISKSVYVNGVFETKENTKEDSRACTTGDVGYSLKMNFDSSDNLVTDNIDELQATICLHFESKTILKGLVRSKIILGNNYSKILGPVAINLIKDQVSPLINAITEEIKSKR